jgi:hypothetical protein
MSSRATHILLFLFTHVSFQFLYWSFTQVFLVELVLCIFSGYMYRVFRAQADWTLTHTSHKDTEQSTIEASITLDGVTRTDQLIR